MIKPILEKKYWDEVLAKIEDFDCHHTFEYHAISKQEGESILLLVYQSNEAIIALPLIKRVIQGSNYFDCTSAYGYVGPIFSSEVRTEHFIEFQNQLKSYFNKIESIHCQSRKSDIKPR